MSIGWWLTPNDRRPAKGSFMRIRIRGGHRELMAVKLPSGTPLGVLDVLFDKGDVPVSAQTHDTMNEALAGKPAEEDDDGA